MKQKTCTLEKINKAKNWIFEKTNKNKKDKSLTRMSKKRKAHITYKKIKSTTNFSDNKKLNYRIL